MGETQREIQDRANALGITYDDGRQTGCPYQAYYDDVRSAGFWISTEEPPCRKRSCGHDGCHRYGKPFIPDHGRWAKVPVHALAGEGADRG